MLKILDCSTRDGGHSTNWNFSDFFISKLVDCQIKSGISFCEIGYRNNIDRESKGAFYYCDKEFFDRYKLPQGIKYGVMVDVSRFSIRDFMNASDDFVDFVRVASHPDEIKQALHICEKLKYNGYNVFFQLMDITNINNAGFQILKEWLNKDLLTTIYIADTYGSATPTVILEYFRKLNSYGYSNISFHAHNKSNRALENTLVAINSGAYSVDISYNSKGRNGGNLCATELLKNLSGFSSIFYDEFNNLNG